MTKHRLGNIVVLYGAFLVFTGGLGFLLTGETSTSSIMNGIIFGSLMILLGVLLRQGRLWTLPAATSATAIFTLTFVWRGVVQWAFVANDGQDHLSIAVLLTVMLAASAYVLAILVTQLRR